MAEFEKPNISLFFPVYNDENTVELVFRKSMAALKANANKMYHLGIGEAVSVSTITRAHENRSFQIYEDLAM